MPRSWSSTTMRRSGACSSGRSRRAASGSGSRRTAARRLRRSSAPRPTCSCSTWRCRASTALPSAAGSARRGWRCRSCCSPPGTPYPIASPVSRRAPTTTSSSRSRPRSSSRGCGRCSGAGEQPAQVLAFADVTLDVGSRTVRRGRPRGRAQRPGGRSARALPAEPAARRDSGAGARARVGRGGGGDPQRPSTATSRTCGGSSASRR